MPAGDLRCSRLSRRRDCMKRVLQIGILLGLLIGCRIAGAHVFPVTDTTFRGITSGSLTAIKPVDPDLIPEGRKLLNYLDSVYGKKVLTAQEGRDNAKEVYEASGKYPAILSLDLSGWTRDKWNDQYRRILDNTVEDLKKWHENGGIVSMQWHWANPLSKQGTYKATKSDFEPKIDVGKVVTPGTREHKAAMKDMRKHGDILERFAEAGIPILWRPLHEIDGGWFWWTDHEKPENTARLWRMMYDYYVNERGLHNLIWVYSAGLHCGQGKDVEALEYRKRFYPGAKYVDIAGIDIYPNDWFGWPHFRDSGYSRAHRIMQKVAPGKMLALCEAGGIPDPRKMDDPDTRWLYCLSWWAGGKKFKPEWIEQTYRHDLMLTRDDLPDWIGGK